MLGPDNSATKQKLIHSQNWKEGKLAVLGGGYFLVLHPLLVAFFLPVVPPGAHLEKKKKKKAGFYLFTLTLALPNASRSRICNDLLMSLKDARWQTDRTPQRSLSPALICWAFKVLDVCGVMQGCRFFEEGCVEEYVSVQRNPQTTLSVFFIRVNTKILTRLNTDHWALLSKVRNHTAAHFYVMEPFSSNT